MNKLVKISLGLGIFWLALFPLAYLTDSALLVIVCAYGPRFLAGIWFLLFQDLILASEGMLPKTFWYMVLPLLSLVMVTYILFLLIRIFGYLKSRTSNA